MKEQNNTNSNTSACGAIRVIAGSRSGKKLHAPPGLDTRPVTAMIKGALFNIWQGFFPGARFLDLFSGSGSMGVEALSLGASYAVFVEKEKAAADIISKNLAECRFDKSSYNLIRGDVFDAVTALAKSGERFDIIYLDPPFTVDGIFLPVIEHVGNSGLITQDGIAAIRTKKEKPMPDAAGKLNRYRIREYGISAVHFYKQNV